MKRYLGIALLCVSLGVSAQRVSFDTIDAFLESWDQFAQGRNELMPKIRAGTPAFESTLAAALRAKDPRAPSRVLFYAFVRVGLGIPTNSDLGRAWIEHAGPRFPIRTVEKDSVLLPPDFYQWWLRNRGRIESYALMDAWMKRDFARRTAIPMYESLHAQDKK